MAGLRLQLIQNSQFKKPAVRSLNSTVWSSIKKKKNKDLNTFENNYNTIQVKFYVYIELGRFSEVSQEIQKL